MPLRACSLSTCLVHSETLPGDMGNRGIMSFISREQGNTSLKMKETGEQR